MIPERANPLLGKKSEPTADLTDIAAPTVHRRSIAAARAMTKREIVDMRRAANAAEAIGTLTKDTEVYGFTKGQFSVIDILHHCLTHTGPGANLQISTWTAANSDITTVLDLCNCGRLGRARWLVDLTFNRRSPELAQRIRDVFGDDAIRVAKNHAKFMLLSDEQPDGWRFVIRTSMNLNFNPRFENFQLGHDPEMYDFHNAILDEVWAKQRRSVQDTTTKPYDIEKHFHADL